MSSIKNKKQNFLFQYGKTVGAGLRVVFGSLMFHNNCSLFLNRPTKTPKAAGSSSFYPCKILATLIRRNTSTHKITETKPMTAVYLTRTSHPFLSDIHLSTTLNLRRYSTVKKEEEKENHKEESPKDLKTGKKLYEKRKKT